MTHSRAVLAAGWLIAATACGGTSSSPTAVAASAAIAAPTAGPAAAPTTTTVAPSSPAATTPATTRNAGPDVDGDGRPDTVAVRFVSKRSAVVTVRLATGKSLTSKAFALYQGDGAGTVTGYDVNGDGRTELFVADPGADGVGYDLFSYVRSAVVAVPAPKGQEAPYLYIGGGQYYESTFRCTAKALVQVKEAPAVASTATLPPDPAYRVTTTTYRLADGVLKATAQHAVRVRNHAAAQALLDAGTSGCGTTS